MNEQPLHLLILTSWYPTEQHPFLGNFVEQHARLLAEKYTVTLIHTQAHELADSISVHMEKDGAFTEMRVLHPIKKTRYGRKKIQERALEEAFGHIEKVDVVIGEVLIPRAWQFVKAKKHFSVPLIYFEHGSFFREEVRKKWTLVEQLILQNTKPHIAAIVSVSEFLKNDLQRDFPSTPIHVIGNSIDTELFSMKKKEPGERVEFLHVSTLDEHTKNPEGIIDACKDLLDTTPDFRLTIVSEENTDRWKKKVQSLQLQNHIEFVGPLTHEILVPYYHRADALVLFSDYETFSIVIAEAWATGTPVISTSVGIAFEMDPSCGILVEKGNSTDLSAAMLSLIKERNSFDPEHLRENAMKYSRSVILDAWSQLIDQYVQKV